MSNQKPHVTLYEITGPGRKRDYTGKEYRVVVVVNTTELSVGDLVRESYLDRERSRGLRFTIKAKPKNHFALHTGREHI